MNTLSRRDAPGAVGGSGEERRPLPPDTNKKSRSRPANGSVLTHYRIARIGGDGIGPDVIAEAVRVLEAAQTDGLRFSFEEAEVGAALYRRTGEDLPRETVDLCRTVDAILFGAAGLPDIRHPDGTELTPQVSLRMILDLYAGMRPVKLYPGVPSPLRLPPDPRIDYVILRENTEGLFASLGGGSKEKRSPSPWTASSTRAASPSTSGPMPSPPSCAIL